MSAPAPAPAPAQPMGKEPLNSSDLLEEDDEFEEFEQQEWTGALEDPEDPTMWQDGWEDDEEENDFTRNLRAELDLTEGAGPPPNPLAPQAMQQ